MKHWDTVAVVGVGLIGGSIGLDLLAKKLARRVVGIGRRQTSLDAAKRVGAVTETTLDLRAGVGDADLIVVCTPVGRIVDDVLAAMRWVQHEAAALGLDPARLAVGGDSAGGNLAAVACLALRDAGHAPPLKLQLLIYPATDMRAVAPSHTVNGQGYLLTNDTIAYFRGHYCTTEQQSDWRTSPLLHGRFDQLPPAFVLTAGFDPLRDEGRQYADALSAAGTPTQYVCFERQIHGFITMGRVLDEAGTAVALCGQVLRRALGTR